MTTQLALRFDEVPLTCEVQARYHSIAGCLAGKKTAAQVAAELNLGYSTVTRWLRDFRQRGMAGLFPAAATRREPYTPERVIVQLLFFKCCVPKVGDRELARVLYATTGRLLHHQTVRSLCERYFFWRYAEFQKQIRYPAPDDPQALRLEIVRLEHLGWTEVRIAELLRINRKTARKWLRRAHGHAHSLSQSADTQQLWLLDLPRAPQRRVRKVYFGVIHATLELQKKYGHAGWFRIKGYLERDYQIYLSPTTIKKVMALNRRVHLAPRRPLRVQEVRDPREGPPHSKKAFEHVYWYPCGSAA